jgi:1,2-diacylglycerol 3-beta-galactosyltransferase
MENLKRILILTADAGFGHRSAALAIQDALQDKYGGKVKVDLVNPLEEPTTPPFLRETQYEYDRYVRNVPELYQLGYEVSDRPIPTALLESSIGVLLAETMRELLNRYQPDVVVSTYPWYQAALTTLFASKRHPIPQYTVVTDLSTVHRMWFHRKVTGCMVPNTLVADLAMSYGMPPSKVLITGIPVSPAIAREKRPKTTIRQELGWRTDLPTILAVGSKRVERMVDALQVINHFGGALQVAVVCGKDENLFRELQHFDWHIPAHIYEYSDDMPTLMKAADLMLCKAGGLIVTESLACGLPMLLIEIIPGQETGNAEYVTSYGAADLAETPMMLLESLNHLMKDNGALLEKRATNARKLGQPESAHAIADILWYAAQTSIYKKTTYRRHRLPMLENLSEILKDREP